MSNDKQWFDPDNLAAQEQAIRGAAPEEGRGKGDFGSYALVNRGGGLAGSGIESHNLIHAEARARLYRQLLGGWHPASIADLGCGLGLTSGALKRAYPQAAIQGFEVSGDAVDFAARTFPTCRFTRMALAPDSDLGGRFELVLCQEFYPFTRTGDWETHRGFLHLAMNHLAPGGRVLVVLSERDSHATILNNRGALATLARDQGWTLAERVMPYDRVFRNLPILALARPASWLMGKVLRRDRNILITLSR